MFFGKPYYQFIPYHLLKLIKHSVQIRLNETLLTVPTRGIGSLTYLHYYPNWQTEVIKWLLPYNEGVFIDIGANLGQTLLSFLAAQPQQEVKYIGFEPNPKCVDFLRHIIRINQLNNCIVVPIGLSNSTTLFTLYLKPDISTDTGASIINDLRPSIPTYETQLIPCYCFDSIGKEVDIHAISLVKIDVEGAELEVLKGIRNSLMEYKPFLICEVLYADYKADLDNYARRMKFLMELLFDIRYLTFRICKKDINKNIEKLIRINSFPVKKWTYQNCEECDYLLIPEEKVAAITHSGITCEVE